MGPGFPRPTLRGALWGHSVTTPLTRRAVIRDPHGALSIYLEIVDSIYATSQWQINLVLVISCNHCRSSA